MFWSGDKLAGGLTTSSSPRTPAPLWNVNRPSEPGLFAKQCAPRKGRVVRVHGIPPVFADGHHRARSSKRAGGFIPRIALDECRDPERYRTRASISRVWFNSRMRLCQGRDDGATPFTRSTCPCGVVQPTRLPLMQEITGAKPVRDANFIAPKALSAMRSLGKRVSPVQLRVGAPF